MPISKVGIDIVEVERFRNVGENFLKRAFLEEERGYCKKKANAAESFAGIFAAKEAVMKALQAEQLDFTDIEIKRKSNGAPYAVVQCAEKIHLHLSISHAKEYATAICIAEKSNSA
jgi:phosphopantetheine--protein transferase-like protein